MTNYTKTMMDALAEVRGLVEASMKPAQIAQLKKAYEPMRDKKISVSNANKLSALMDKFADNKDVLIQLVKADIPFVSTAAVTRLISKHGMKGAEINKFKKEEMEFWAELDEGKEKDARQLVDPKKEVMVVKKNNVIVIDKKDEDKYLKQGWSLAGEVDLDEKTKWKMGDGRPRGGAYIENERFWDLDIDALKYIMKDADTAMKANPTGRKAGKYADEVNDAHTVIGWRKKNGIKEEVAEQLSKIKGNTPADQGRRGAVEDDIERAEKKGDKKEVAKLKEDEELDEGRMKELHGYIEAGKSAEWIAKKMGVDVKTIKSLMSGYNEEVNLDEASGDKEAYQKFFNAALKKFKVSSPAELEGDQKKKFYDYIDANWEADNEKAEAAMSQVREFKIQSMKAALAQIWGMEEGKNPFKKEDDDDDDDEEENKKKVKTETGKKPAAIDLKPKIDDR